MSDSLNYFLIDQEAELTAPERRTVRSGLIGDQVSRDNLPAIGGAIENPMGAARTVDASALQVARIFHDTSFLTKSRLQIATDGSAASIMKLFSVAMLQANTPECEYINVGGLHFAVSFDGLSPSRDLAISVQRFEKIGAGARAPIGNPLYMEGVISEKAGQQQHEFFWLFVEETSGRRDLAPIKLGVCTRMTAADPTVTENVIHDFEVTVLKGGNKPVTISVFNGSDSRFQNMLSQTFINHNEQK